jgi:RNA polymerase sigma-70 factor (ECF subfamily)
MFEDDVVAQIPKLRGYAHKLTRNAADADDLLQGTMLKALRKKHLFAMGTNVRSWLYTIMHNLHVSNIRNPANSSVLLLGEDDPFYACNTDPDLRILMLEVVEELERLPPSTRRIIKGIAAGLSYEQVARRESLPIGTVRSRMWRGRAKLREFAET